LPEDGEAEGSEHCEDGSKGYATAELRCSYLVVQAACDLQAGSRRAAAVGPLEVEKLEILMAIVVRPARKECDCWFDGLRVRCLSKGQCRSGELFEGGGRRIGRSGGMAMQCNQSGSGFIHVDTYKGVFPDPAAPWFTGVTDAVDAVCDSFVQVTMWCGRRSVLFSVSDISGQRKVVVEQAQQ
jgi:hypothetical protein